MDEIVTNNEVRALTRQYPIFYARKFDEAFIWASNKWKVKEGKTEFDFSLVAIRFSVCRDKQYKVFDKSRWKEMDDFEFLPKS